MLIDQPKYFLSNSLEVISDLLRDCADSHPCWFLLRENNLQITVQYFSTVVEVWVLMHY